MQDTFRTAAMDTNFARDLVLNQTSPKVVTVPSYEEIWVPPLVCTRRVLLLGRMLERNLLLLHTHTVNCLSSKIRASGMILYWSSL